MIQIAILPGPNKPEDLDSFLSPLVDEIQNLSTNGMIVKRAGVEICRARVHLVAATGDIVGISDLIHHAGHNSNHPCRYCLGKSEAADNDSGGKYLLDTSAPLRKTRDFVNADTVSLFENRKECIFNKLYRDTVLRNLPFLQSYQASMAQSLQLLMSSICLAVGWQNWYLR